MQENFKEICAKVVELTKEVGNFLMEEKGKIVSNDVEVKGAHDYVTYVDKTAERFLVEGLSKIYPIAGFITEEGTIDKKSDTLNWIVDPLDGTTNFIHGLAPFCISIGLKRNDEMIMGVIYEPNLDEAFYAYENSAAYLNGKEIKVSDTNKLDDSLLATGFPYYDYSKLKSYMNVFEYCLKNTRGVRRLGSAAIDLAYVACGRMDGFFEYGLRPWDVAAGSFIVQQAGGDCSDFSGGKNYIFGKEIIAFNNKNLHQEFLEVMDKEFKK